MRAGASAEALQAEVGQRAMRPAAVHELFEKHVNDGRLEELARLYEPEAVFVERDGKRVSGAPAIKEYLRRLLAMHARLLIQNTGAIDAGDVVVLLSEWRMERTAPDGSVVVDEGRTYDVVRRRRDGTWRIVVDNPWGAHLGHPPPQR